MIGFLVGFRAAWISYDLMRCAFHFAQSRSSKNAR